MPVHRWSLVSAGGFHHFHSSWIAGLAKALNSGVLPEGYYALQEQVAGGIGPDVLALESSAESRDSRRPPPPGVVAAAVRPPAVSLMETAREIDIYALKRRRLSIRHASDDRLVAVVEILSRGTRTVAARSSSFSTRPCPSSSRESISS